MHIGIGFIFCFISATFCQTTRSRTQFRKCEDSCILLRDCDPFLEMLRTRNRKAEEVITASRCGKERPRIKVCCPVLQPIEEGTMLPSDCGENPRAQNKIIFGEETKMGEFPWIAALEYKNIKKKNTKILCSGSLINPKYVLTAAHCVDQNKDKGYKLYQIRLGEWDLTKTPDCFQSPNGPECAPPIVYVHPEKIIRHQLYTGRGHNHDIALIRLTETIDFSNTGGYILPVCLPSFGMKTELLSLEMKTELRTVHDSKPIVPIVIGWGRTESKAQSEVLLKADLPFSDPRQCTKYFFDAFGDKQLCVGGTEKDSCSGDSGGPLMLAGPNDVPKYLQIGIVSFGAVCGANGIPAVYTSVSHYKNWILYNMESW